jgi:hypothetical protein
MPKDSRKDTKGQPIDVWTQSEDQKDIKSLCEKKDKK